MRQIIALAGCNLSSEHHRHPLGRAVGEEEIEFCRLDGDQFGRAIELGCHLFLHISHRNLSRSRILVGIIGKTECERMYLASVSIGNEGESLIAHRNMHGIREIARYHRIAGHAGQLHRDMEFSLGSLIERHHQPEDAAESEKEQKNQKLLIQTTEQEVSDSF